MNIEVEQKHRVNDSTAFERRLNEFGAKFGTPIQQVDEYFAHPCRDFAETDEALRIRSVGDEHFVTYKGPKLDAVTKSRRELELPLAADRAAFAELLTTLGFRSVLAVRKTRRPFELEHRGQCVHGAWDSIDGLGEFVELELTADETTLEAARAVIASLAGELELGPSERRSYLELLLEKH